MFSLVVSHTFCLLKVKKPHTVVFLVFMLSFILVIVDESSPLQHNED